MYGATSQDRFPLERGMEAILSPILFIWVLVTLVCSFCENSLSRTFIICALLYVVILQLQKSKQVHVASRNC